MRRILVALAIPLVVVVLVVPGAQGRQGQAVSAKVQALWAGERLELGLQRLRASERSLTSFWARTHAGEARVWLRSFLFRAKAALAKGESALGWSGHSPDQLELLRRANALARDGIAEAKAGLKQATQAWRAMPGQTMRSQASVAAETVEDATLAWFSAELDYQSAARPQLSNAITMVATGVLPTAGGVVRIYRHGWNDRVDIEASGLEPNVRYSVALTQQPSAPYGAGVVIGSLTADETGEAAVSLSGTLVNAVGVNAAGGGVSLDYVVVFYADPAEDNELFAPGADPGATAFDVDGSAGAAVLTTPATIPLS